MGQINQHINDDLDKKFRDVVYQDKGMKRGVILEALEEALDLWIKEKAQNTAPSKKQILTSEKKLEKNDT